MVGDGRAQDEMVVIVPKNAARYQSLVLAGKLTGRADVVGVGVGANLRIEGLDCCRHLDL